MGNDVVLGLVVITALAFDFTNGFHDTGNAMATTIATGALRPRIAVALSGALNLVGAFLSLAVAATIASGLVDTKLVTLTAVAVGLTGRLPRHSGTGDRPGRQYPAVAIPECGLILRGKIAAPTTRRGRRCADGFTGCLPRVHSPGSGT